MITPITKTQQKFIPYIAANCSNQRCTVGAGLCRHVLTRALAIAAIFHSFISNALIGCGKTGSLLLKKMRLMKANETDETLLGIWKKAFQTIGNDASVFSKLFKTPQLTVKQPDWRKLPRIFHQTIAKQELANMSPAELDKNWNLNKYFGHVYVINLDDLSVSPEKLQQAQKDVVEAESALARAKTREEKEPAELVLEIAKQNVPKTDKHKKRLQLIQEQFDKVGGCKFERLRATRGAIELDKKVWSRVRDNSFGKRGTDLDNIHKNQAGCYMSHYRAIKDAYEKHTAAVKELENAQEKLRSAQTDEEKNVLRTTIEKAENQVQEYSRVLIFEDDTGLGFVKNGVGVLEGAGVAFRKAMEQLPEDFDIFNFNTDDGNPLTKIDSLFNTKNPLIRMRYGLLNNAYVVDSKAYPTVCQTLAKIDEEGSRYKPLDHEYAWLHYSIFGNCLKAYTPRKALAYQAAGESSITDGKSNVAWAGSAGLNHVPHRGF